MKKRAVAYINFTTMDVAIGFYEDKVPPLYEPVYCTEDFAECILERNNAEKREYDVLGRAAATDAALQEAKSDILILILRLLDADETDSAPETLAVIEKWKKLLL
jgi:hypothetical protein